MLKIYQKEPTVVIGSSTRVVKIYQTTEECLSDFSLLRQQSGAILSTLRDDRTLKLVKMIARNENILIMERVNGICLSRHSKVQNSGIVLVGKLLATRHNINRSDYLKLGDFSIEHLYVSYCGNSVTYIDPGNAFLAIGDKYEDLVRLLFSIAAAFRFNPIHVSLLQSSLLFAYFEEATHTDLTRLEQALYQRYLRICKKYQGHFSKVKLLLSLMSLRYQFLLTKRNVKIFGKRISSLGC